MRYLKNLKNLSDKELTEIVFSCLKELEERWASKNRDCIVYCQGKGVRVTDESGIPLDRREWLYLPYLRDISHNFQPPERECRKCYTICYDAAPEAIKINGKRFKVDRNYHEVEITDESGLVIRGRIKELP